MSLKVHSSIGPEGCVCVDALVGLFTVTGVPVEVLFEVGVDVGDGETAMGSVLSGFPPGEDGTGNVWEQPEVSIAAANTAAIVVAACLTCHPLRKKE